ncbi:WYL domain-containing protein [Lacihabitans sp. CCS-44]|uniref:WYL domain-containing protein n=1 Tax=Lacihabitans sp. CCS-44 TaxID=2487331 RepID=UPI0020CF0E6E|nr:WYL domain-containing protein [Lacihabitans sp. CCS-44]MCP9757252.1 WYL domain-containing protein [Lacihabitans sp. CCS-44]
MKREKALNLIRLLDLLSLRSKTKGQLARILGVQVKQINRYYQDLENFGLHLDEDIDGHQFIFGADQIRKGILEDNEKEWICSIVQLHDPEHPFTQSIKQKLGRKDIPFPLPEQINDAKLGSNYDKICFAIAHNLQIELVNYHSPMSANPKALRLVEPIEFNGEHRQLQAYEVSSRKVKSFKIDRIELINLKETYCHKNGKRKRYTDPFGISSDKKQTVEIQLSQYARELIAENHPLTKPYLIVKNEVWYYYGPICGSTGIGRFILGLPGHIEVIEGAELLTYLQKKVSEYSFATTNTHNIKPAPLKKLSA